MEFNISSLKIVLTIVFGLVVFVGGIVPAQVQIRDPLTLEMLLTGLRSKSSGASLAELNEFIKLRVNELGVDFLFTPKVEKDLRAAGAGDLLIEIIRRKAPKIVNEKARGEAKVRRETRDEAIAGLTLALEKNPKDAESYKKRAALYENNADYRPALEDYVRTLEIAPEDQTAKYRFSRILEDIGDYFITQVRRSDSIFERDAFVKGFISIGNVKRREMMLNPPFYNGDRDTSTGGRKEQVHVLVFVNEKGQVVSANAISNQFWLTDSAVKAAKTSSFFELKSSGQPRANDWVIVIYEYIR